MTLLLELGFIENTGTATADTSGAGRHGTLTGDVTWATGKNGAGVAQTGGRADNSRVNVPRTGLEPSTALTLMAWVKTSTSVGYDPVIEKPQSGTAQSYALWSGFGGSGEPYVTITTSVSGTVPQDATTNIHDGGWHHIAGTYDGALLSIYVDGTLEGQELASGTIVYDTNDVGVGGSPYWAGEYVNGTIDEVRIFDTALTAGEIVTWRDTPVGLNATVAAVAAAMTLDAPAPAVTSTTVVTGGGPAAITFTAHPPTVTGAAAPVDPTAGQRTLTVAGETRVLTVAGETRVLTISPEA